MNFKSLNTFNYENKQKGIYYKIKYSESLYFKKPSSSIPVNYQKVDFNATSPNWK